MVKIFNIRGQRVRTLNIRSNARAAISLEWDGKDERGIPCPQGIFLLILSQGGVDIAAKRVSLLH